MKQKTGRRLGKIDEFGDLYTFVAIDADSKLVPCWHAGKRMWSDTALFIDDLRARLVNRPQITTDAFAAYYGSIGRAFDRNVGYAQLIKVFASELNDGRGHHSPPIMLQCEREHLIGRPDPEHNSTSESHDANADASHTRLTNGFLKKRANHAAAVALHFAHYELVSVHKTLRMTPAMAHGISDHIRTMGNY